MLMLIVLFEMGSWHIAQISPRVKTLMPRFLRCWDYSKIPPCLTQEVPMRGAVSPFKCWYVGAGVGVLKSKIWESVVLQCRLRRQISQLRKRWCTILPSVLFGDYWVIPAHVGEGRSSSSVTDSNAHLIQRPSQLHPDTVFANNLVTP